MMNIFILMISLFLAGPAGAMSAQNNPAEDKTFQLAAIDVVGLKRLPAEPVKSLTGLKVGQTVSVRDLRKASECLGKTGLFANAGYRFTFAGDKLRVQFRVEEKADFLPCYFDNLFWLSDGDLERILRTNVLAYDGSAPEGGIVVDQIIRALNGELAGRHIPGTAVHTVTSDLHKQTMSHLFRIDGVDLPIAAVKVTGAKAIKESVLEEACRPLVGQQYSRVFAADFALSNLAPMYRLLGHLAIRFDPPQANQSAAIGNRIPQTLVLNVNEGPAYTWKGITWSGNSIFSSEELNGRMDIKIGQLADGVRIDKCLADVQKFLGTKGLMAAKLSPQVLFDDSSRQVQYLVSVVEGRQFRMGDLAVTAGNGETVKRLNSKWNLKQGEVYNAGYYDEYIRDEVKPLAIHGFATEIRADPGKGVVDITIRLR